MVASSPRSTAPSHFDAAAALHALDDGYYVVDERWRIVFANRACDRLLGLAASDPTGRVLWDAFPTFAEPPEAEVLQATMRDGLRRSARVPCRDPQLAYFDTTVTPIPAGGIAVQFREVSESAGNAPDLPVPARETEALRDMARALLEQEDLSALLGMLCREAMARCDADGATVVEILQAKEGGESEQGRSGEAVISEALGITKGARLRRFVIAGSLTERAIATRAPASSPDYVTEYAAHAAALFAESVGPMVVAPLLVQGQVLGVLGVSRRRNSPVFGAREERWLRAVADHAALAVWKQRLIQDAQEASLAKSEFISTISHEFRTPLAAVAGYEELLADQILGPLTDKQLSALGRMRSSIQHLSSIMEEILTFSRLEAGEVEIHPQRSTTDEILTAAAAVLEPLARAKGLELAVRALPRSVGLNTDLTMLRRILVNLGANAVKFTDRGSVWLETSERGEEIAFVVRDTGIGIAPEHLSRLFRPFTQLESGFTRRFSGTGLGLFVSHRLAHLLGGHIEVESMSGQGSTFTVVVRKDVGAGDG